ncbi:MAG: hypothetical protein V1825_03135 [Candidatus Falkowbacteria bacterium]|nr:hypothetical protein [Candidatus Parcubacteria bacterium]
MTKFKNTQKFTKTNIKKISENKAIVYKIKNFQGDNLYTGIAGRNRGQDRLNEHKDISKDKIPGGTKFQYAQVKNKNIAEKIEKQIIKKEQPKFNIKDK